MSVPQQFFILKISLNYKKGKSKFLNSAFIFFSIIQSLKIRTKRLLNLPSSNSCWRDGWNDGRKLSDDSGRWLQVDGWRWQIKAASGKTRRWAGDQVKIRGLMDLSGVRWISIGVANWRGWRQVTIDGTLDKDGTTGSVPMDRQIWFGWGWTWRRSCLGEVERDGRRRFSWDVGTHSVQKGGGFYYANLKSLCAILLQ